MRRCRENGVLKQDNYDQLYADNIKKWRLFRIHRKKHITIYNFKKEHLNNKTTCSGVFFGLDVSIHDKKGQIYFVIQSL